MNSDISFWEPRWKEQRTGWDLGGPHPALERLLSLTPATQGLVWVPGCGRGHDAAALAKRGFQVLATDISPTAIEEAKKTYPSLPDLRFEISDLFASKLESHWDLIFDRAMWCALPPTRQRDYLGVCQQQLKPNGLFISIAFSQVGPEVGGPPFAISKKEIQSQLESWEILKQENSKPPKTLSAILEETLIVARKR